MSRDHPLRRYRNDNNLTLAELATQVGTTDATLSRIETRQLRPGHNLLIRLADVTGISIDDLVRASACEAA